MSYPERRKGRLTGKWIAEPTLNGQRLGRKTFDTKKAADRWEDMIKLGLDPATDPSNDNAVAAGPTFEQVAEEFIASKSWDADVSGMRRVRVVVSLIGPDVPIQDVNTKSLDKLVANLKRRPGVKGNDKLTPGTINRYLSAASAVLHYARVREYAVRQPTVPWQEDDAKRIHWLTEDQELKIIHFFEDDPRHWHEEAVTVLTLTETGMRWSEFTSLTPEQIEPDTGWIRLWKTKNGSVRSVPISRVTAVMLRNMVAEGRRPEYHTMRKRLKLALKSAGVNPEFSVHGLRHTTATRLITKGVPLPIVQKYLGHRTIATTLRYVHLMEEDLQSALKKISPHAGEVANPVSSATKKAEELEATAGIEPACTDLQSFS